MFWDASPIILTKPAVILGKRGGFGAYGGNGVCGGDGGPDGGGPKNRSSDAQRQKYVYVGHLAGRSAFSWMKPTCCCLFADIGVRSKIKHPALLSPPNWLPMMFPTNNNDMLFTTFCIVKSFHSISFSSVKFLHSS
tara:strand:+ start:656 stop:1063 length:408 start_codon:yes stop_codon:yes gene_type:complete